MVMMHCLLTFSLVISAAAIHSTVRSSNTANVIDLDSCSFAKSYPRHYIAYAAKHPPVIDGKLDEPFWDEVPWTDKFVDIATTTVPRKRTWAKLRWDKEHLYIAGYLEDDEVWANLTKHDSVIFHDNDFEVFVDPAGSTHNYKEFEVNALGTTWDLSLNKPYGDGGEENSGRTKGFFGWESNMRAATYIMGGKVNEPGAGVKGWTVELAIPIDKLLENQDKYGGERPGHGKYWRINFSRVQWHVLRSGTQYVKDPKYPSEDNWVWSPQGEVQMHLPERWGVLQFSEASPGSTSLARDPEWSIRHVAASIYDAQKKWAKAHNGEYTANLQDLQLASSLSDGSCTRSPSITLGKDRLHFKASISSLDGRSTAEINDERFVQIKRSAN